MQLRFVDRARPAPSPRAGRKRRTTFRAIWRRKRWIPRDFSRV